MRVKINPFVTVSDLMAGVAAVIMLLLVVVFVRMSVMEAQAEMKRKQGVDQAIKEIRESMDASTQNVVVTDSVITLNDAAFERGSACLNESIEETLRQKIAPILSQKMLEYPNISVQIEGHTDTLPVKSVSTNIKTKCALFDDNYSLSAGRAREARKAILAAVENDKKISRRIAVVGFGPDVLKDSSNPEGAINRRVEIRLIARNKGDNVVQ